MHARVVRTFSLARIFLNMRIGSFVDRTVIPLGVMVIAGCLYYQCLGPSTMLLARQLMAPLLFWVLLSLSRFVEYGSQNAVPQFFSSEVRNIFTRHLQYIV
jgi:hypothetical protein